MAAKKQKGKKSIRDQLLAAIATVDRPGTVCVGGDRPMVMPGLEVEGLGTVRLPLGKTQAKNLIKLCRQAPYGKGTETLVDTDVRRTWELDPDHFEVTNPKWDVLVTEIVADVQQELGLESQKLTPHLYKLLVYESGGFFVRHRDSEKLDGMVATLVIGLPSIHEGGTLIVTHDEKQHTFAMPGAAAGNELSYAAFYADCEHEVTPVLSGCRLCLTYNVTLARARTKKGKKGIPAPSYHVAVTAIAKTLGAWSKQNSTESEPLPQKLAVVLEHHYTETGLTLNALKGIDRARADVLFNAAEQAGCIAHLALVSRWESGSAIADYDDYDNYHSRRRYRHDWDDDFDDDDEDEENASDYEMDEVFDESLTATHWSDREGKKILLGQIPLNENEIVSETPLLEWETSREEFEGFTGNAGMTLERWYHRAAIVIWPRERHFAVLCAAGTDSAVGGLTPMVRRLKRTAKAKRELARQQCLAFATAIIDSWNTHTGSPWNRPDDVDRGLFLELLSELDDPDLVRRFLREVLAIDKDIQVGKALIALCKRHGWPSFEPGLEAVIEATSAATITRNAELLRVLCVQRDKNADRIELCNRLVEQYVTVLARLDDQPETHDWRVASVDRAKLLSTLVIAMLAVHAERPMLQLVKNTMSRPDKYDLTKAHLAAMLSLKSRLAKLPATNQAITHWLTECRTVLETVTARAPEKPTDYRRAHELPCKCSLCRELSLFLADPDERVHRFRVRKELRRHLHGAIDSNHCDLTHVTNRRGSPFTLVCTKTMATYDKACEIHDRDMSNLGLVIQLGQKLKIWPT